MSDQVNREEIMEMVLEWRKEIEEEAKQLYKRFMEEVEINNWKGVRVLYDSNDFDVYKCLVKGGRLRWDTNVKMFESFYTKVAVFHLICDMKDYSYSFPVISMVIDKR